jgi:hypothetical protein
MNINITNFSGGLFTPKIDVRADTEKYSGGCRKLENMFPRMYGVAEKRTGSEFITSSGSITHLIFLGTNVVCYENNVVTDLPLILTNIVCRENEVIYLNGNYVTIN